MFGPGWTFCTENQNTKTAVRIWDVGRRYWTGWLKRLPEDRQQESKLRVGLKEEEASPGRESHGVEEPYGRATCETASPVVQGFVLVGVYCMVRNLKDRVYVGLIQPGSSSIQQMKESISFSRSCLCLEK